VEAFSAWESHETFYVAAGVICNRQARLPQADDFDFGNGFASGTRLANPHEYRAGT
jgi:hypothetical protein